MPASAISSQLTSTSIQRLSASLVKNEKIPIRDPSKTIYAIAASAPDAMPQTWPSPWVMKP